MNIDTTTQPAVFSGFGYVFKKTGEGKKKDGPAAASGPTKGIAKADLRQSIAQNEIGFRNINL